MSKLRIISDTRNQDGWKFEGYPCEMVTDMLMTGDYSLAGLSHIVSVERKSKGDLLSCLTDSNRVRLKNELERMRGYPYKALIAECSWEDINTKNYRSEIHPNSVYGSLCSWCWSYQIPIFLAGDKVTAERICFTLFKNFISNQLKLNQAICQHLQEA